MLLYVYISYHTVPFVLNSPWHHHFLPGIIHIADWYATLCYLAGVDATDTRALQAKLPAIDSLNMWPLLNGSSETSPRELLPLGPDALIWGRWKLLIAPQAPSFWQGPKFPNSSSKEMTQTACQEGCLFDVEQDLTEHHNLYQEHPEIVVKMMKKLEDEQTMFFENKDSFPTSCPILKPDQQCPCWMAHHRYGGFLGPYALLDSPMLVVWKFRMRNLWMETLIFALKN